jgi:hypothetical protein
MIHFIGGTPPQAKHVKKKEQLLYKKQYLWDEVLWYRLQII